LSAGYLLDTNAISEGRKPRPDAGFVRWISGVDEASLFLSVLTFGELRKGVQSAPDSKRPSLERWLTSELPAFFNERVLAVDLAVADRWGKLDSDLRSAGRTAPAIDCMLAATALVRGLTIVSRNARDFSGLCETLNPWTAADAAH
jgi:predicted nucleic acid-binding protein